MQVYIIISFLWPWIMKAIPALQSLPTGFNKFMSGANTIGFLWLNAIGALGVVLLSIIIQVIFRPIRAYNRLEP